MKMQFLVTNESLNKMVQTSHWDHLREEYCRDQFPLLVDKNRWPRNSSDLNRLNNSIWDALINIIDWNKVQSKTSDTG